MADDTGVQDYRGSKVGTHRWKKNEAGRDLWAVHVDGVAICQDAGDGVAGLECGCKFVDEMIEKGLDARELSYG